MVSVPQAIIDERTVVVERLDTAVADGAVERSLRFHQLIVGAEVLQVESIFKRLIDQGNVIVPLLQVARVHSI